MSSNRNSKTIVGGVKNMDLDENENVASGSKKRNPRLGAGLPPKRKKLEVQSIVNLARNYDVSLTVKNGGHSYTGSSTTDTGILLDMAKMNRVELNMENQLMAVQGGALWGNAYKPLINARLNGWVVNGGRCPTVGVSGFILGGGIGPFSRSLGMGCDTVTQFTLVTADGKLVTVGENDDPLSAEGALFWALRGAGGGNFGVVVSMILRVLPLGGGEGVVTAGRYTWFPDPKGDHRTLLNTMNRFYTTNWSDQMTIDSSWFSDTQVQDGAIGVRFLAYYDGNEHGFGKELHNAALDKDLEKQLKRRVLPEKSTRFLHETLVAQWDEETVRAFPSNGTFRIFSSFCFGNDHDDFAAIPTIVKEELEAFRRLFRGEPNCLCQVSFIHSGGETTRRERNYTAFRWRDTVYHTYIMMQFRDKWLEKDMRGFLGKFKDRLKPLSLTKQACFVAFPDASLADDAYEKAYYGENRLKLQQVKRIFDKTNFFNWPQGIKVPSSGSMRRRQESQEATLNNEEEFSDSGSVTYEDLTDKVASERWENAFEPAPCEWLATGGPEGGGVWLSGGPAGGARLF
ncbi:hypothetical protein NPX13_g453 [Xylaria arbuscula]|uniref:FAD-binding PCMH-type domain-containing protein n=1 Tax=Xylaria arbuscula TaxID=114810 RepID=A0A9W8TSF8_9PEZI|nr:hypothetical protein NPX13_g453 [Xylaria arbuscula]